MNQKLVISALPTDAEIRTAIIEQIGLDELPGDAGKWKRAVDAVCALIGERVIVSSPQPVAVDASTGPLTRDALVEVLQKARICDDSRIWATETERLEWAADAILAAFPAIKLREMPAAWTWGLIAGEAWDPPTSWPGVGAAIEKKITEFAAPAKIDEEALAKAIHRSWQQRNIDNPTWNQLSLKGQESFRGDARAAIAYLEKCALQMTAPAPVVIDEQELMGVISRALFAQERWELDAQRRASCDNAARAAIAYFKNCANVTTATIVGTAPPKGDRLPERPRNRPSPADVAWEKALELRNAGGRAMAFELAADLGLAADQKFRLAVAEHVEAEIHKAKRALLCDAKRRLMSEAFYRPATIIQAMIAALDTERTP